VKYTRDEFNRVIEVRGCTTCPHMADGFEGLVAVMYCTKPQPNKAKANKKLTSRWTGPYHASCPLASNPEMVPALEVKK
jgi:hypothetical protein